MKMTENMIESYADLVPTEYSERTVQASIAISLKKIAKTQEANSEARLENWRANMQAHGAAMRMIRDAIEELFGVVASLESADAVLLRGPEPHHDAEAVIAALQRVKAATS